MQTTGTFEVTLFEGVDVTLTPAVETALPIGVARMTKTYAGAVSGRSATVFVAAYDGTVGSYVAMEAFEGTVDGRAGTFVYLHSASTGGADRSRSTSASPRAAEPASWPASGARGGSRSRRTARTG